MSRPTNTIDGQLATLVALQKDCDAQMRSVRQQIVELQSHELSLTMAYGSREKRIDMLLDERNLNAAADELVRP